MQGLKPPFFHPSDKDLTLGTPATATSAQDDKS
jgi:hypothetical protein